MTTSFDTNEKIIILNSLLNSIKSAVFATDIDGRLLFMNSSAEK